MPSITDLEFCRRYADEARREAEQRGDRFPATAAAMAALSMSSHPFCRNLDRKRRVRAIIRSGPSYEGNRLRWGKLARRLINDGATIEQACEIAETQAALLQLPRELRSVLRYVRRYGDEIAWWLILADMAWPSKPAPRTVVVAFDRVTMPHRVPA